LTTSPLSSLLPPTPVHSPLSLHDALPISFVFRSDLPGCQVKLPRTAIVAQSFPELQHFALIGSGQRRNIGKAAHEPLSRYSGAGDRKSTRLNSSHGSISYAVFCLKKKNT